jgi:hypothetical protein
MPYNLLLLPLITGYFILSYSLFFKYNTQRFTQNRLLFESFLVAVILIFLTFFLRTILDSLFPEFVPRALEFLRIVPIQKVDYLWSAVCSMLLTIIVVAISNGILLLFWGKTVAISRAVDKNGDEIEKLFKKSFEEGKLIQVTLKNNKFYIGFSDTIPEPQKTNYLILNPVMSGYRNSETKKMIITTDYLAVIYQYNQGTTIQDISMIIKQDEVLTAGIYEQELFELFNSEEQTIDFSSTED